MNYVIISLYRTLGKINCDGLFTQKTTYIFACTNKFHWLNLRKVEVEDIYIGQPNKKCAYFLQSPYLFTIDRLFPLIVEMFRINFYRVSLDFSFRNTKLIVVYVIERITNMATEESKHIFCWREIVREEKVCAGDLCLSRGRPSPCGR
jgi:hypothetical protein